MAEYDIRSVAQYLEAENQLADVFKPRLSRRTVIQRAGSVLATLEVVLETSIFEFGYDKLPIDEELVRHFVQKSYFFSPKILSDTAWKFLLRYVTRNPSRFEGEPRPFSFGRISGIIELSEHLLCNDAIGNMLTIQDVKTRHPVLASAVDVLGAFVQGTEQNQGLADFKRFIYNVRDFTNSSADFSTDGFAYRAILECVRPLLAKRDLLWQVFKGDLRESEADGILAFWKAVEADLASSDPFTGVYAGEVLNWSTGRILA